ncbi:MAG: hypothetical protein KY454_14005 [Actinobacteria bacterium]|nr:hypothetical protein [Actinomycetota bacterium]MBW3614555.1 hypothetical protein [Actinomycetota bacterium]
MAALSLVADGAMGAIAPCRNRLNGDLPEPRPGPVYANQSSHPEETYPLLETPSAAVGPTSSVVTLLLAWAARAAGRGAAPAPLAIAAKAAGDALGGVVVTDGRAWKHRRLVSSWLVASAASVAIPGVAPEARAPLRQLRWNGR